MTSITSYGPSFKTFEQELRDAFTQATPKTVCIAVAYYSNYGAKYLSGIADELGIKNVSLVVDLHDAITHPQALRFSLGKGWAVRGCKLDSTFHAKLYIGTNSAEDGIISGLNVCSVGSSNLTFGGLSRNSECNLISTDANLEASLTETFFDFWWAGEELTEQLVADYEQAFAKRNRRRSPVDLKTLGVADDLLVSDEDLTKPPPSEEKRTIATSVAEVAWAGMESFTGEYTLQVEFPRDAGLVLRTMLGSDSDTAPVRCDDGQVRTMTYRYYEDNGMFRLNIPNDVPNAVWAREHKSGLAVVSSTESTEAAVSLSLVLPDDEAYESTIRRSIALGTWGQTTTRRFGWY